MQDDTVNSNDTKPAVSLQERPSRATSQQDNVGIIIVVAAFLLILVAVLNATPLQSANDRSRWCTVWSLVERGTYHIDEIDQNRKWSTIDKVRHRHSETDPYHFYSSKPPLFPTMVAGLYWLEKKTLGYDLTDDTAIVTRLILVVFNAIPMLFALLTLRASLRLLQVSDKARWFLLFIAGFACMLNPFLTTLNNHTPAAISLTFCLAAMIRIRSTSGTRSADYAIVGLTAALICCFELPAALFGILSFLFVVRYDWRKTARFYVPAALLPLAAFFVTNWICTGGIKPFYAFYGTEKYVYVHEGIPSYWSNPQGIDSNVESTPVYLFHCLFGHHGLFSLTPVFLMTIAGWLSPRKGAFARFAKPVMAMGGVLSLVVLTFYLTRTQNYNYGGNSSALRWMLWLTPFWWYGMVPTLEKLTTSRKGNVIVLLLIAASVYSVQYSIKTPWRPGWVYDRMQQAGLIDYRTKTPPFEPQRRSLIQSLPKAANVHGTWYGSADAAGMVLSLKTLQDVRVDNESGIAIMLSLQTDGDSPKSSDRKDLMLVFLRERFEHGTDVLNWAAVIDAEMVLETSGTMQIRMNDLQPVPTWASNILRGLPNSRVYNAESSRYLQYRMSNEERTAIRCERGAAQAAFDHAEFGACRQRCDVLWNNNLPFGLAQFRIVVTNTSTEKVMRTELWTSRDLPK